MQVPLPFCGSQLHRTPEQPPPQRPQLFSSDVVSTQTLLQHAGFPPFLQAMPQAPQFATSERVSTHMPVQHV